MKTKIKIKLIENYIKENRLSKNKFCKICKISLSTLNKILANKNNFKLIALFRIAKVIKIEIYQMFY